MHVIFLELPIKNNKISKDFSLFAIAIPQKVSNPGRNDSVTQVLRVVRLCNSGQGVHMFHIMRQT